MSETLEQWPVAAVGDYVLATKYDDGDPGDHFCIGFVSGYTHHRRYHVIDGDGKLFRGNGFRRVEKITAREGQLLLSVFPEIGDKSGPSLWEWLGCVRIALALYPDLLKGDPENIEQKLFCVTNLLKEQEQLFLYGNRNPDDEAPAGFLTPLPLEG